MRSRGERRSGREPPSRSSVTPDTKPPHCPATTFTSGQQVAVMGDSLNTLIGNEDGCRLQQDQTTRTKLHINQLNEHQRFLPLTRSIASASAALIALPYRALRRKEAPLPRFSKQGAQLAAAKEGSPSISVGIARGL
ncbi:hypothetical protein AAFF_G00042230 [Aldrovandia affinis]|uniref:Uncharacterized protein n=1 Tax=Aldrovandia affinis TaxID=143900 RepID=A0AAD7S2Q4_9TELE|nr:hypothetical protein AAFF_G00042230 [Aldrovandia affinis]